MGEKTSTNEAEKYIQLLIPTHTLPRLTSKYLLQIKKSYNGITKTKYKKFAKQGQ